MKISDFDRSMILRSMEVLHSSHDPHRQVGVVVADQSKNIVSFGTNAPPAIFGLQASESLNEIKNDPEWKYYMLEHAERNAIYSALMKGVSLQGATLYGTLFPCADCARAIAKVGISRVVLPKPGTSGDRDKKWLDHYRYARKIFELAGVKVDYFDPAKVKVDDI